MKKEFYKTTLLYFIGNFLNKFIQYFSIPLGAIYLTATDFGVIALISIVFSAISILIISPSINGLNRFYYENGFKDKGLVLMLVLLVVFISFMLSIVLFLCSDFLCNLIFFNYKWVTLLKLYSLNLCFFPTCSFLLALTRIQKKTKIYVVISILSSVIYLLSITLFFVINFGIYSLIMGELIRALIILVFLLVCLRNELKSSLNIKVLKSPLLFSYPLIFSDLSLILFDSLDRYILKLYVNLQSIGIYDIGYRISSTFQSALGFPIDSTLQPLIYEKEGDSNAIKSFLKKMTTYYYALGMGIGLLISFFSYELIKIVLFNNQSIMPAYKILPVLIFGHVIHVLGNFLGWGIILKKKSWTLTLIMFFSLLINIVLNLKLVPLFGINGAAYATLISYFLWSVLKIYFSKKYYQLNFELINLSVITIITILFYLIGNIYCNLFDSMLIKYVIKASLLIIYCFFVYFRIIDKEDRKKIKIAK